MSVSSQTTVEGGPDRTTDEGGPFEFGGTRGVETFCAMLYEKHLEPVVKNGDAAYR